MNTERRHSARHRRCRPRARGGGSRERGAILIVVMMIMLGVLGLGVTAYWLTTGNLQVASSMNQRAQALYAAEAGLERARAVLDAPVAPNLNALLAGIRPGAGDDVPSDTNPAGVGALMIDGAEALANVVYPPASFGRTAGTADNPTAASLGRYTVWIRNDTGELRQQLYTSDGNDTVVLRAQGTALDGRTTVIVEVVLLPSNTGNGGPALPLAPTACHSGKNACDDNSSTVSGIVISSP